MISRWLGLDCKLAMASLPSKLEEVSFWACCSLIERFIAEVWSVSSSACSSRTVPSSLEYERATDDFREISLVAEVIITINCHVFFTGGGQALNQRRGSLEDLQSVQIYNYTLIFTWFQWCFEIITWRFRVRDCQLYCCVTFKNFHKQCIFAPSISVFWIYRTKEVLRRNWLKQKVVCRL